MTLARPHGEEVLTDMSSRPLVIAGIIVGTVAGVGLCVGALVVVAIDGAAMSAQAMSSLMLGVSLGVALDAIWLAFAVAQLGKLDDDGEEDDGEGGGGWGRPGADPARPRPPGGDPDWWPEFERDLRAHLEARDKAPVPD